MRKFVYLVTGTSHSAAVEDMLFNLQLHPAPGQRLRLAHKNLAWIVIDAAFSYAGADQIRTVNVTVRQLKT